MASSPRRERPNSSSSSSSSAFDALELRETAEGVVFNVKVKPRAKRAAVEGVRAGRLLVSVPAPPERGRANRAVVELLARALGVPKGAIEIVAGGTRPEKTVRVRGVSAARLRARLIPSD